MKWFRFAVLILGFSVAVEAQTYRLGGGLSRPENISVEVRDTKKDDLAPIADSKRRKKQVFLTGTVYDPNRGPISGVKITFRSGDNSPLNTKTDNYGHYEIGLMPGRYFIQFASPGFKPMVFNDFRVVKAKSGKIKNDIVNDIVMEIAPPVNAPVVISDSPGKP